MERLTKRVGVDEAVPICDFDICAPFIKSGYCKTGMQGGFPRRWERHCNDACILGRMIDRLADYEDTGLTPEQVVVQKWIPVKEKLPQEDLPFGALCEVVQVLLNDGSVTIGWCNRGLRCWFHMPIQQSKMVGHEYENTPVVAWKPLAQPPKEVNK